MKKILPILLILISGCAVISPGERGIQISLGKVAEDPKPPGAYLWIPFFHGMSKMNVQIQKTEVDSTAASRDMQDVRAHVAVNWAIDPANAVRTYKDIGDEDDVEKRILIPAVNEVMKASTAKLTAEEVLTKRMQMKQDIDDGLMTRLAQYGIKLSDVSIVNLKFSDDFTHAIESKQIAEQEAQQAKYVTLKATQEAKAQIERAKGQNEAQRLLQVSTTPTILKQQAIAKWDGHFPKVMLGKALPFLNFSAQDMKDSEE